MFRISCKKCKGTGFVKKNKKMYCSNNIYKLSSHLCVKCENTKALLHGKFCLINVMVTDIILPKTS
jgi:hypothetical protein